MLCTCTCIGEEGIDVFFLSLSSQTEGEGTSAELALCTCGERVLLQKALPVEVDKNSDVMKALVRANPSYATSTISSLLGGSRDDTCELQYMYMYFLLHVACMYMYMCIACLYTCTCTCIQTDVLYTCTNTFSHTCIRMSLYNVYYPSPLPLPLSAGATSTGLSMKILQKCAAYSTGSALVLLSAPPTPPGGRGGLFGVQGGNVSKSLCYNICFSIQTGKSLGQVELLPTPQLHCALTKGASMMATGELTRSLSIYTTTLLACTHIINLQQGGGVG